MGVVFWPGGESPFSTAKEWLLAGWVGGGFLLAALSGLLRQRKLPQPVFYAAGTYVMAVALSAALGQNVSFASLIQTLLPCAAFLLLIYIRPDRDALIAALVFSGILVAAVAVLQAIGFDPFLLINLTGSLQGSSRIRVFSTLGNPNFVAAYLTGILLLTVSPWCGDARVFSPRGRIFLIAAGLIQAAGLIATGSRAPVLGLAAAGMWLIVRRFKSWIRFVLPAAAICSILIVFSPARPLGTTLAGRVFIWKIIGRHLGSIPVTGYGSGAFSGRYAEWEAVYLHANPDNAEHAFAGFQDHAHNDYLEFLVDNGILGLAAFLAMIVALWVASGSTAGSGSGDGVRGAMLGLLGVAAVDFPLHRPAELFLFWSLMALMWLPESSERPATLFSCGGFLQRRSK
jgi:O-antigen ligase